jgi:predicted aspartyl protease
MRAFMLLALWVSGAMAAPQMTPFERGQHDVVLAVRLNGRGPFRMVLDTGSTHTAISPQTAAAIGAPIVAKATMGSAAGSRETLVARLDVLEVGPIAVRDLLASVLDLDRVVEGGIDGVIGHDALASLRYTIDFRERRVVWWPDNVPYPRASFELESVHGRFLVVLPQRESLLRLVPDSGASSLLLFDTGRTVPVQRLTAGATLTTMSAETQVRLARLPELRIGDMRLRNVPAVIAKRDSSEPAEVDGLLPLHLFDRVTLDGPGKRLMFF